MGSISVVRREDPVAGALNALDAAVDTLLGVAVEALSTREQVEVLRRVEQVARRLPAVGHRLVVGLRDASPAELGDTLPRALADALRISRRAAGRRVADAADLGPRRALSGEPLAPWLPATAAGQRAGRIGEEHVEVIRDFFAKLPGHIEAGARADAERDLAALAEGLRPDELRQAAARMELLLNPDGEFSDQDRACRRGLRLGRQRGDGMSLLSGWLDPQCRATLEAVLSKWAAPGMCNPEDESPQVDGDPEEAAAARDTRTTAQRNHDALTAVGRAMLASGQLGSHRGLPVTVIVSTTLAELEAKSGHGVTAGGTVLPMSDVLRLACHAFHYLVLFDGHGQTLHLGRSRRTASPGQRIVLHSKERGCSHPGCPVPGYGTEVHHAVTDWAQGGLTNVDDLTFACKGHHRLITKGGWTTRKRADGITEWIPPPHLDTGQARTNAYHHPDRLLPGQHPPAQDDSSQ
jgi:hypothetical protein